MIKKVSQLRFRPDIEGLRALSILLVFAAHAKIPGLEGGFIGVDIFFVISGYLITGMLREEISVSGTIDMAGFFARRIRRLLPAYLVTLVGTGAMATVLMAPSEQLEQIGAAAAAAAWGANIYFAFLGLDYFGSSAGSNLFLHTWSLGVEEQFYLIWPILMLFAYSVARLLKKDWQWFLVCGFTVSLILSFVFSSVLLTTNSSWSFYLMPLRAWQFALGALCLFVPAANWQVMGRFSRLFALLKSERYPLIAGWCGLFLILASAIMLNSNAPYPGLLAIFPSIGAALILLSGVASHRCSVDRLMSLSPMVWLGRRSYSLYLWHWPVLLLGGGFLAPGEALSFTMHLMASLGLAVMTFNFVEMPVRHSQILNSCPRCTIWGALSLMAMVIGLSVSWIGAAATWLEAPELGRYREVRFDIPEIYAKGCDDWFHSSTVNICQFGTEDAGRTVVLFGDSIGAQWFPALATIYHGSEWRLLVITKSACPIVDMSLFYPRIGREYVECKAWRDDAIETIASLRPELVFIGSARSYGFTEEQWVTGTRSLLEKISGATGRVYLIQPTPIIPFDGPHCLGSQAWRARFLPISNECVATVDDGKALKDWLTSAASGFANVGVLDMNPVVCPENRCAAELRGHVVYRDNQHLTARFVVSVSDDFVLQVSALNLR